MARIYQTDFTLWWGHAMFVAGAVVGGVATYFVCKLIYGF